MPFIKIHPLQETEAVRPEYFGRGNPARCQAERRSTLREIFLNLNQIAAFEECPLYLSCDADPNALVNGIRLRLVTGEMLIVTDDPEDDAPSFHEALSRASHGEIVELGHARHLRELEQQKLI